MPKKIDYPKASIANCLELAKSVDQLGGMSDLTTCAEHLGKKVSGAFHAIVNASSKFGFTSFKSGQLQTTSLYRDYKLAYNDDEKKAALKVAFFNVPVFKQVFDKFKNGILPVKMLDKILVREFQVDEKISSRVSKYFIEAARISHLLKNDFSFASIISESHENTESTEEEDNSSIVKKETSPVIGSNIITNMDTNINFTISIVGPGMNSSIEINEEEDFIILEAMLNKIKKRIQQNAE